ncbi:MAG: tRNA (adenosine(37)-N6)-dimethylallyltransferase MiaA [Candidatus Kapaibacterium sp.]
MPESPRDNSGDKPEILVITGPTASGKTAFAFHLAKTDPSIEIVSADVQLLYRGFDIGTAKPSAEERARVLHHLIDILDPSESFSASEYSEQARRVIREILARKKTPVIVGGSGLYIDAIFHGILQSDTSSDAFTLARNRVKGEIATQGFERMHAKLKDVDPELYLQIAREMNPLRLQRAWEFYYATGKPLGQARKERTDAFEYKPRIHLIEPIREALKTRIENRIDEMLAAGWMNEVEGLRKNGVTVDMPSMRAIGYLELASVLEGQLSLEAAREKIIVRTRQYAKRQVTWMKRYRT